MNIPATVIPVAVKILNNAYVSLWELAGGQRMYGLKAADRGCRVYLPPPAANTMLTFFRADDGTSGHVARVHAKISAPLNGSATDYVSLAGAGDAITVIPSSDLTTWETLNYRMLLE